MLPKDKRKLPTKGPAPPLPRNEFLPHAATQPDERPFALRDLSPREACQSLSPSYGPAQDSTRVAGSQNNELALKGSKTRTRVDSNSRSTNSRALVLTSPRTIVVRPDAHPKFETGEPATIAATVAAEFDQRKEKRYYEQRGRNHTVQRPGLVEMVSKEDYLLGRGANPRTGLVTPGSSTDSQSEDVIASPVKARGPSAKWRQKGDQWVSLSVDDEPTPRANLPLRPSTPLFRITRPKTPQRFSQWNSSVPNFGSSAHQSTSKANISIIEVEQQAIPQGESNVLPGSYPSDVIQRSYASKLQQQINTVIRRKPVAGTQDVETIDSNVSSAAKGCAPDAPITPPQHTRTDVRSFSAPTGKRVGMLPIGKAAGSTGTSGQLRSQFGLPKAGSNMQHNECSSVVRSFTSNDLNQLADYTQASTRVDLDKELPSLPTTNDRYQQSRYNTSLEEKKSLQTEEVPAPETHHRQNQCSQMKRQVSAKSDSHRSHIVQAMVLEGHSVQNCDSAWTNQGINAIPNYDNPPLNHVIRRTRPFPEGSRPPQLSRHVRGKGMVFNDVFTGLNSNVPVNVDMYMPMPKLSRPRHRAQMPFPPQRWPPPMTALPPRPKLGMNDKIEPRSRFPNGLAPLDQHCHSNRQRTNRPQMPPRALDVQQIPGITEPGNARTRTRMKPQYRSNMAGPETSTRLNNETTGCDANESMPVWEDQKKEELHITDVSTRTIEQRKKPHPKGRCSQCHHCLEFGHAKIIGNLDAGHPRKLSTDSSNAPEVAQLASAVKTTADAMKPLSDVAKNTSLSLPVTSANILNVKDDLHDHSMCCPDCCKLDCHNGCIGHSSPYSSSSKCSDSVRTKSPRTSTSLSSLSSSSSLSSTSNKSHEPSRKVHFMKSMFKIPFLSKRSDIIFPKPSLSSMKEGTSQQTHQPLSTTENSQTKGDANDQISAMAITKKGVKNGTIEKPEHDLNQFMVLNKRSRPKESSDKKKQLNNAASDLTTTMPPLVKINITANERRKVSGSRPCSGNQASLSVQNLQSRSVSVASADIDVPSMRNMANLLELLLVPYEAIRMWLQNNPQVAGFGWSTLDCLWSMICVVAATMRMLSHTLYIYSKTGKFRVTNAEGKKIGVHELIRDAVKSSLFLLVFASLTVILGRIFRIILLPMRFVISITRGLIVGGKQTGFV